MPEHRILALLIVLLSCICACQRIQPVTEKSHDQPHSAAQARREANVGAVRRFFDLMHEKDIEGWAALWAPDGKILVAYPPEGFPDSIHGQKEIASGFRQLFTHFGTYDFTIRGLYPSTDPDVVIIEWDVAASLPARGETYRGNNITVFVFREGLIAEYHDYFDPRKFQVVVDAMSSPE